MKSIKKILVATDFSDNANNAFRYALEFASKCDANICLLNIIYPELEPADVPVMSAKMTTERVNAAEAVMKVLVETNTKDFDNGGMPEVERETEVGMPSTTIVEFANKNNMDLIIMGAKGEHNLLDRTIGNTTASVMDFASCPVLVVPESTGKLKIETIAYATDLVPSDPFHIWEAGKLLKPFSPVVRVVHVQKRKEENKPMEMAELEAFFKGNPPALQVSFHNLFNKKVKQELETFIKEWDIDLMIMNKPNRSIVERIFHASLTKKTALYTKIPFMVLK